MLIASPQPSSAYRVYQSIREFLKCPPGKLYYDIITWRVYCRAFDCASKEYPEEKAACQLADTSAIGNPVAWSKSRWADVRGLISITTTRSVVVVSELYIRAPITPIASTIRYEYSAACPGVLYDREHRAVQKLSPVCPHSIYISMKQTVILLFSASLTASSSNSSQPRTDSSIRPDR